MKKAAIIAGIVFVVGIASVYVLGTAELLSVAATEKATTAITYLTFTILGIGLAVHLATNKPKGSN